MNDQAAVHNSIPSPGTRLVWGLTGGAALFYWVTLNHWVSLASLPMVFPMWDGQWQLASGRPLAWLAYALLRWLPPAGIPLGMNMMTALAAALVLGQLARAVMILRVDVVAADAMRQRVAERAVFTGPLAWVPPVVAVLALGLQAGFWEHATNATGELFSLLCFAFAARAILEHRLGRDDKWLYRAAGVMALGLTDNWWGLAYLPVFVAAVIWTKGWSPFLAVNFLVRMLGAALLGLSVYLLVPVVAGGGDYWETLRAYLGQQKSGVLALRVSAFRVFALVGLLPFLLLAVRWRSHSVQLADDTAQGVFVTRWSGHLIHAVFLGAALWLALEPVFTPYQLTLTPPPLAFSYAWALVAGYGGAYLLVFGMRRGNRVPPRWPQWGAYALLVLVPLALVGRNGGNIRLINGGALREFASQLNADLPPGTETVLSDDARVLRLARMAGAAAPASARVWVDTAQLPWPQYHDQLRQAHPQLWPELPLLVSNRLNSPQIVAVLTQVATNGMVAYLHPSSGLFFEQFTATPHGWAQPLQLRGAPNLSAPGADAGSDLWEMRWTHSLARRAGEWAAARHRQARWTQPLWRRLKLTRPLPTVVSFLGEHYAKALNHYGVELARGGDPQTAVHWYERALICNPDNVSARLNLEFARAHQRAESRRLTPAQISDWLTHENGRANWAEVVSRHGPVDEPTALVQVGRMYLLAGYPHQALERVTRSVALAPEWSAARLAQAQALNAGHDFNAAVALTAELVRASEGERWPAFALAQLLQTRTVALQQTGQTNMAAEFLEQFTVAHQSQEAVVSMAVELYAASGGIAAELRWLQHLVRQDPKRVAWLVAKGDAEFRRRDFPAALNSLEQALALAPADGAARWLRARVAVAAGQLELAERDFRALLPQREYGAEALFGLGGIAWRQQNTHAMISYYQAFLTNQTAPPLQRAVAAQRLKEAQHE